MENAAFFAAAVGATVPHTAGLLPASGASRRAGTVATGFGSVMVVFLDSLLCLTGFGLLLGPPKRMLGLR